MANIVRCKLPTGIHRLKPFTVQDYRDILLIRTEMASKTSNEQTVLVNEMLADYFSEFPESYRPYIFLKTFSTSIGKTRLPVQWTCSTCNKVAKTLLNIQIEELKTPVIETCGVKINFKFPDVYEPDPVKFINENIYSVDDGTLHLWTELSEEDKLSVIDAITLESIEQLLKQIHPIYIEIHMNCCDKRTVTYTNIKDVVNLLLNPDEVFSFYQTNHVLTKSHYDLNSVMKMIPMERTIALSLIEKDNKK